MPVAKQNLLIGFTVAATKGSYITKDAVKTYGWEDLVDDGPDLTSEGAEHDDKAPKGRPQKGS